MFVESSCALYGGLHVCISAHPALGLITAAPSLMYCALGWCSRRKSQEIASGSITFQSFSRMATFSQRVAAVRPTMRDVINLSRGEAATRRGLGSRRVPHRLNAEERKAYELAERKGFVAVIGSGMRRERKGSPLLNILRQRADALAQPLVWVEKASRGQTQDFACIDYSPLRLPDADALSTLHSRARVRHGLRRAASV